MRAALLSIGTELTRGELINTNAAWLAERLTELGFRVTAQLTVDDDPERIAAALRGLSADTPLVIATGGLGPTTDDRTSDAAALACGRERETHEPSLEQIRRRYAASGREVGPQSAEQARFPTGAEVLPNPVGTAPGFGLEHEGARWFFLPGVPHEMKRIFEDGVVPLIGPLGTGDQVQLRLRTFGLPESVVGERLAGIEEAEPRVTLGYRATFPEIEVKVLAQGQNGRSAEEIAQRVAQEVRERLGEAVYGEGDDTYAEHVGRLLRAKKLTLSVAESCTGGMVGSLITAVPGSSEYLLLDAVTYSNAAKSKVLGVSGESLRAYGAVSEETAAAMAEGARRLADADLAVSITGVAGPGGGSEEKPVGTVCFGLARRGAPTETRRELFPGDRQRVRVRAAYTALSLIAGAAREADANHGQSGE